MELAAIRDEIKLKLTGNILETELDDATIDKIIYSALRELQRYICSTKIITIPYSKCIDLSKLKDDNGKKLKISSIARIFRAEGFTADSESTGMIDPMQATQWQLLSGTGNLMNFQDYVYNYASWNTLLQIRNTTSTDLAFRYDRSSNKLYINIVSAIPDKITIEYIQRYDDPSQIESDYWIDMLIRMSLALCKITVGRIRSRFTQANALWNQDGNQILEEGKAEYNELQQYLSENTQLVYGID